MDIKYERDIGLDIVKAIATIFVISVHFFSNTKFYLTPLLGKSMGFQVILHQIFLSCVPLFMISTGYINKNISTNKKYYKKLTPIIVIYFVYSILSLILRSSLGEIPYDFKIWIKEIMSFTGNPYSWYVNMFVGLFIIAPFLNILYNNINLQKDKIILLVVLLLLTAVPPLINGHFFDVIYFPYYWISIYPITYYFIGKYINEFKPNINKLYCVFTLILLIALQSFIEIYYADGNLFKFYLGDYPSLLKTIQSAILFILLYKINLSNKILKSLFILISSLSLDIYLCSYVIDRIVYGYLSRYHIIQQYYILLFIPIIFIIFSTSLFISYLRKIILKVR